jgi:hypothetical protein
VLDTILFPSCILLINLYAKVHKYYATGAKRAHPVVREAHPC